MDTKHLLNAMDAMEYVERGRPGFDLKEHRRIRASVVRYQCRGRYFRDALFYGGFGFVAYSIWQLVTR